MMLTVAPCFVAIFGMLLESTVTGLTCAVFYQCLIGNFLVSIVLVLLDTPSLRMVHHFFEKE